MNKTTKKLIIVAILSIALGFVFATAVKADSINGVQVVSNDGRTITLEDGSQAFNDGGKWYLDGVEVTLTPDVIITPESTVQPEQSTTKPDESTEVEQSQSSDKPTTSSEPKDEKTTVTAISSSSSAIGQKVPKTPTGGKVEGTTTAQNKTVDVAPKSTQAPTRLAQAPANDTKSVSNAIAPNASKATPQASVTAQVNEQPQYVTTKLPQTGDSAFSMILTGLGICSTIVALVLLFGKRTKND